MDIKTKLLWCLVLLIMRGLCCCCWLSVVIRMTSNSSDSAGFFSSRRSFTLCIAWKVIQEKIERLYLIYSIIILLQSFIVNVCYCWINQNVIVFIKKKRAHEFKCMHNFKLITAAFSKHFSNKMNLWICCVFFLYGRLIPIWCSSEYLGQQVGWCMGLFYSYSTSVHHNPRRQSWHLWYSENMGNFYNSRITFMIISEI